MTPPSRVEAGKSAKLTAPGQKVLTKEVVGTKVQLEVAKLKVAAL